MVSIGGRLREQRVALGLNQTEFGALGGVTKKTQVLYEAGERAPDAGYLSGIAAHGADVLYILTGQRAVLQVTEDMAQYVVTRPDEAALLDNYRHLCKDQQDLLKATSAALAESAKVKRKAG